MTRRVRADLWKDLVSVFFPPRTAEKDSGEKERVFSFRCSKVLGDFIDSLTARGYSVTETMVNMTTFSRDVMGAFEGVGILLQLEAEKRGVSLGTAVGQIAAEALAKMYPEFQRHSSKPKPGK